MSNQWLTIEQVLKQASVVLSELQEIMGLSNTNPTTQTKLQEAKTKIEESLQDKEILQEAAQKMEYQSLIQKLEAVKRPITEEQLNRAKKRLS